MPFVNTTPLPTTVFVAPTGTGVNALCILKNESPSQTLFVGLSACTPKTGIPLPPNESIKLNSANSNLYACSNWVVGTQLATTSSSAYTAGTIQFTTSASALASLPVGTYFVVGGTTNASQQEVLCVATSVSTTVLTTTTASLFDHAASQPLYAATTTPGILRVERGTGLPPVQNAAIPMGFG